MVQVSQWLSVTGLVINVIAALYLLIPQLPPGKVKHRIDYFVVPVRQLDSAYHRFIDIFSFESDPRVFYYGEKTPEWIDSDLDKQLTETELDIIANLLIRDTWRWDLVDCNDFSISRDVDLPDPEYRDIWSGNTFEFDIHTVDGHTQAYYPMNDWTRKQLHDSKTTAVTQIYTLTGATCLLIGFFFQIGGFWISG